MSRAVLFTPRARRDIDDIWDYSVARWGDEQAERYVRAIQLAIEAIAADPRRALPCDDIRPGYRKHRSASHVVFVRLAEDDLIVVRVLHARMDVDRHL